MIKTQLEKWWDETFAPKKKTEPSALLRFLRKPKGAPNFADKRMQRGVQKAIAQKSRAARLERIYDSMRQGVRVAKERRDAYVQRRTERWKTVVENTMPAMFAEEMSRYGF